MRFELPSLRGREAVVLGASGILSGSPFRLQLAVLLQTVQRREQRSLIDRGLILAEDRESLRDAIAVLLVRLSYLRSIGHPFGRHSAGKRWSPAREIHREREWFD